jgi:hypothetical protein
MYSFTSVFDYSQRARCPTVSRYVPQFWHLSYTRVESQVDDSQLDSWTDIYAREPRRQRCHSLVIVVSNMDSWRKLWTFFMSLELAECKEWDDARSKWKRRGGKRMFFPPFCSSSSLQKKWSNFFSLSPTIGRSATARLGIVNLVSCAVKHFCHKRLRRDEKRKKKKEKV